MAWFSYQHAALTAKMNQIPKHRPIWWCFRRQNEQWIGLDWVGNLVDWVGLDFEKWTHGHLWVGRVTDSSDYRRSLTATDVRWTEIITNHQDTHHLTSGISSFFVLSTSSCSLSSWRLVHPILRTSHQSQFPSSISLYHSLGLLFRT